MREVHKGETQDPSLFAEIIAKKDLPIDPTDAIDFAQFVIHIGAPEGFLDRLVETIQYKSEPEFALDFEEYAEAVVNDLAGKPYSTIFYKRFDSGRWIHELLMRHGLHPAEHQFTTYRYRNEPLSRELGLHDPDDIPSILPEGTILLIPDDFTLSGAQMGEMAAIGRENKLDTRVAVLYTSELAEKELIGSRPQSFIHLPERIKSMKDNVTPEDIIFMQEINDLYGWETKNLVTGDEPFFWTWYKIPDNVPEIFTEKGHHPLVRNATCKALYRSGHL